MSLWHWIFVSHYPENQLIYFWSFFFPKKQPSFLRVCSAGHSHNGTLDLSFSSSFVRAKEINILRADQAKYEDDDLRQKNNNTFRSQTEIILESLFTPGSWRNKYFRGLLWSSPIISFNLHSNLERWYYHLYFVDKERSPKWRNKARRRIRAHPRRNTDKGCLTPKLCFITTLHCQLKTTHNIRFPEWSKSSPLKGLVSRPVTPGTWTLTKTEKLAWYRPCTSQGS